MKIFISSFIFLVLFTFGCKKDKSVNSEKDNITSPDHPKEIIFIDREHTPNQSSKLILDWDQNAIVSVIWYKKKGDENYKYWYTDDKTAAIANHDEYQIKRYYENSNLVKIIRKDLVSQEDRVEEVTYSNYIGNIPHQIHSKFSDNIFGDAYGDWNQYLFYDQNGMQLKFGNSGQIKLHTHKFTYGNSSNPLQTVLAEIPMFYVHHISLWPFVDPVWAFATKNPLSMNINDHYYYQFRYDYDANGRPIVIKTYNADELGDIQSLLKETQIKY